MMPFDYQACFLFQKTALDCKNHLKKVLFHGLVLFEFFFFFSYVIFVPEYSCFSVLLLCSNILPIFLFLLPHLPYAIKRLVMS